MQDQNHVWRLLARCLAQEATEDERNELEQILSREPDLKISINKLINFWHTPNVQNKEELERLWDKHLKKMNKQNDEEQSRLKQ